MGSVLSFVWCLTRKDDISILKKGARQSKRKMGVAYYSHKEFLDMADAHYRSKLKANGQKKRELSYLASDQYYLKKVGSMIQHTNTTKVTNVEDHYSNFLVQPLYRLYFSESKHLKRCTVIYLLSQEQGAGLSLP